MRQWLKGIPRWRRVSTGVGVLVAIYLFPVTAEDYPRAFRFWSDGLGSISGDVLLTSAFVATLLFLVAVNWPRGRPTKRVLRRRPEPEPARTERLLDEQAERAESAQRTPGQQAGLEALHRQQTRAPNDELKRALLDQLRKGRELKARVGVSVGSLAGGFAFERTDEASIKLWEERVAFDLDSAGRTDLTERFLEPPPPPELRDWSLRALAIARFSDKTLEERIEFRLVRLNTIIRELS